MKIGGPSLLVYHPLVYHPLVRLGLHERFLLAMVMRFFFKLSRHQCAEKIACVATLAQVMRQMKKSRKKNREKFNELIFLRQNHGLRQRVATQAIFPARWRRDNFQKIASPSQAKNRSCSRGFNPLSPNSDKHLISPHSITT